MGGKDINTKRVAAIIRLPCSHKVFRNIKISVVSFVEVFIRDILERKRKPAKVQPTETKILCKEVKEMNLR